MYYIEKSFEISACHHLILDHGSKCENVHGHNWAVTVYCKSEELDNNGMVVDFTIIKQKIPFLIATRHAWQRPLTTSLSTRNKNDGTDLSCQ